MAITLYDYWRSSAAYRVRIVLALKGVAYERVDIALLDGAQRSPEHLARNPQGFVPTLEVDGAMLTQSLAIIDYLDAVFPEPPLVSSDPLVRSATLARALVIAADVHPLNNLRVRLLLENRLGIDPAARDDWARHWMAEGFAALEAMAGAGGPFLGGAAPDLSDVCLVPQLYNARAIGLPLEAYPRLVAADAAASALPAFAAAHPERVKP